MDLADHADGVTSLWRELELRQVRHLASEPLPLAERCLNCDAPTSAGARWCCVDCRDDFLRRQARTSEGR